MAKRFLISTLAVLALCACLLGLAGCGEDNTKIQGEWAYGDSDTSVVFTADEFKMLGGLTYGYKLNTSNHTITFDYGGGDEGECSYDFSGDGNTLTLIQSDGNGGEVETVLTRISDDPEAFPRYGLSEAAE